MHDITVAVKDDQQLDPSLPGDDLEGAVRAIVPDVEVEDVVPSGERVLLRATRAQERQLRKALRKCCDFFETVEGEAL